MLNQAFTQELADIGKHAGLLDTLKNVAMTEVPGTKPWLLGHAERATANAAKGALRPSAVSGVHRIAPTARSSSGAYDVSAMAKKMGIT